jgi:hypothetical protein
MRGAEDLGDWARITSVVPKQVGNLWGDCVARYERQAGPLPPFDNRATRNGIVLEAMIADFLAGPEQPG